MDTAHAARIEYLARLDAAMRDVPHGIAAEIRAGIAEELEGLDAAATAERIAQLGDPDVIAREAGVENARTAAADDAAAPERAPDRESLGYSRGFAITAALVFGFGGVIVPVVGALAGAAMVLMSALWHRWEKAVGLLLPVVGVAVLALLVLPAYAVGGVAVEPSGAEFWAPGGEAVANPLMPAAFDLWHSGILMVLALVPVSGLWLLWRLRRR